MNPLLYLTPPQVIKLGAATADIGGWACRAAVGAGAMEWEVARAGVEAMYRHIRCGAARLHIQSYHSYLQRGGGAPGGAAGHLGLVPVWAQHGRGTQPPDQQEGPARRHPQPQLLPHDPGSV